MSKTPGPAGVVAIGLRGGSQGCFDEFRRRPRIDRVTEAPQETHAVGKPINQQTNSGLNSPRFAVGSDDPFVIGSCICQLNWLTQMPIELPLAFAARLRSKAAAAVPPGSCAAGVAQVAAIACLQMLLLRLFPGGLLVSLPPLKEVGVGHTIRPSKPLSVTFG